MATRRQRRPSCHIARSALQSVLEPPSRDGQRVIIKNVFTNVYTNAILVLTTKGDATMPTISMFYGILIRMFNDEHSPPHFHAYYGEYQTVFGFDGEIIEGTFPKK